MRKSVALVSGAGIGSLLSLISLPLGFEPLEITFSASLLLFVYATASIIFFSAFGWPGHYLGFDMYDLNRLVVGTSCAAVAIALFTALTFKVASVFSLSLAFAAILAAAGVSAYLLVGCSLLALARRS